MFLPSHFLVFPFTSNSTASADVGPSAVRALCVVDAVATINSVISLLLCAKRTLPRICNKKNGGPPKHLGTPAIYGSWKMCYQNCQC